jgi:adenine-specific DNA-methyltransferase
LPEADVLAGPAATLGARYSFGEIGSTNQLIYADNLRALRALVDKNIEKARLIYIDPPYATGQRFESAHTGHAYDDHLQGASYVEELRARLILLRELVADDGSIYVHLDSKMIFPAKLLMDEVFGERRFRSMITRVKCNPKNFTSRQYGDECDYLLFYTMSANSVWNQPVEPWEGEHAQNEYAYVEPESGRRYKKVPCHAPGERHGATGTAWRGKLPPPGKHWVNSPADLDALDREGRIYWSKNGNPRRKLYLDEALGRRLPNFWLGFRDTQNQNARITGYPTEKNREMLRLIVEASSNEGDVVLDAYAGSGTTLEAAAATGRRWIGIDDSLPAIETALDRLRFGSRSMGSYARSSYLVRSSTGAPTGFNGSLVVDEDDREKSKLADDLVATLDGTRRMKAVKAR